MDIRIIAYFRVQELQTIKFKQTMNTTTQSPDVSFAKIILSQLGGNKFVTMTGCKDFIAAAHNKHTPVPYLQMSIPRNQGKVNRLRVYLNSMDTYNLHFFSLSLKNGEATLTNEQWINGVYDDGLASTFTSVTKLYTSLGTLGK